MHRENLLTLLQNYHPQDSAEKKYKEQIQQFVSAHPDCFERSLTIGHVTASAWLLNKNQTHALLLHHAKLDKLFQLGGHCDGDNDVLRVAIKEAQEESGISSIVPVSKEIFDIDVHLIPARNHEAAHYHYDIRFLLTVTSNEEVVQNHESKQLIWVGKESNELPTTMSSVIRMHHKWISNR